MDSLVNKEINKRAVGTSIKIIKSTRSERDRNKAKPRAETTPWG